MKQQEMDKKAVHAREARADMPRANLKGKPAGTENRGSKKNPKMSTRHDTKINERQ